MPESHSATTPDSGDNASELRAALESTLARFFGTRDSGFLSELEEIVKMVEVPSGKRLFNEGDSSDDVYFVLSGRMRAVQHDSRGNERILGEIGRGEAVGELALLSGDPRWGTVYAVRESVLARLSRDDFEKVLQLHPKLALSLAKMSIDRFRRMDKMRQPPRKPVTVCVLPVSPGVDALQFVREVCPVREKYGAPVNVVTPEDAREKFSMVDAAACRDFHGPVTEWLSKLEASSDLLFLIGNTSPDEWTRRCLHQADEVLLLADAEQPPVVSALEHELFEGEEAAPPVTQTLILLHAPDKKSPRNTAQWLDRRPVQRHFHVRRGNDGDLGRLARNLAGRAVGVVLAGGGAKAFSHFGVLTALAEFGIEPDFIAGTSMGATAAGWRALGLTGKDLIQSGRRVYLSKPTSDFNLLPMISLIRGGRVRFLASRAVEEAAGAQIDVEDTWIPFFCIATDLSSSEEAVLTRGPFTKALLASLSIPGALPPVLFRNHLLVDGGTFNNFPVDVMESFGVGSIIGLAMEPAPEGALELEELPGSFALLMDRFRKPENRRYHLPMLPQILLNSTLTASQSKQKRARERVDLLLQPSTKGVGLLDWERYDEIVDIGYRYAKAVLEAMTPEELDRFR